MKSKFGRLVLFHFLASISVGSSTAVVSKEEEADLDYLNDITLEDEERLLIIPAITINASALSSFLPIGLALAASIASLLATVALGAVIFGIFGKYKFDGYGSYSGYGNTGAYTSYSSPSYRSLFDPNSIDWQKVSLLELIEVGGDIWRDFNPSNVDCQKKLICEIHQDSLELGYAAEIIVNLFEYLNYLKVLKLPNGIESAIDGYLNAADVGLDETADCAKQYFGCKFTLKKLEKKYINKKKYE